MWIKSDVGSAIRWTVQLHVSVSMVLRTIEGLKRRKSGGDGNYIDLRREYM